MVQTAGKPRIETRNVEDLLKENGDLRNALHLAELNEELSREQLAEAEKNVRHLRETYSRVVDDLLNKLYSKYSKYWLLEMGYKLRGRQERRSGLRFRLLKRLRVAFYTLCLESRSP